MPIAESPEWSRFDLGTSLQLLRSVRAGVIRRTLRKLHIRWYHAPAKCMGTLLSAAGVNPEVIKLLPDIVSTCSICRAWSKPGPKSITSTRLPERFNQEVETDLVFVGTYVILHTIDRCTRWSVAIAIPDRSTQSLLNGIRDGWTNKYGSPNELISDQEGGLNEYAAAVLEDLGIKLHLKAKQQHAAVAERHNDLLRRQIYLMDAQAIADGLRVGSRIKSLSGLHCDGALLFWWIPPHFESWNHMFMSGQKSVNLHELGGDDVCFTRFLMEDSIAIAEIRKLNAEIANIRGS